MRELTIIAAVAFLYIDGFVEVFLYSSAPPQRHGQLPLDLLHPIHDGEGAGVTAEGRG